MKVIALVQIKKEIELPDEIFYTGDEEECAKKGWSKYGIKEEHLPEVLGTKEDGSYVCAIYEDNELLKVIAEW